MCVFRNLCILCEHKPAYVDALLPFPHPPTNAKPFTPKPQTLRPSTHSTQNLYAIARKRQTRTPKTLIKPFKTLDKTRSNFDKLTIKIYTLHIFLPTLKPKPKTHNLATGGYHEKTITCMAPGKGRGCGRTRHRINARPPRSRTPSILIVSHPHGIPPLLSPSQSPDR